MTEPARSTMLRYGGAAAAVLVAAAARLALHPALGNRQPFVTIFLAVILAAWSGGLGPSLLALGLGAAAGAGFLLATPAPLGLADILGFALFLAVATAIVALGEAGRAARRRLEGEVAERRRAEQAGHAQAGRLRATLRSFGDGVIVADADGRVVSLNPVAEALTGWGTDEAAGRPLADVFRIVAEGSGEPVETPAAGVLREGRTVGLADRTALLARDGTRRPIEDSAAPIRDAGGQITGVVLVFRDVSGRRTAEEALRERERQLRLVTDHAPVLIAHCDARRRFRFVNRAYAARFGLRPEEIIGRTIPEVLGRGASAVIEPHIEAVLSGRRVEYEADVPYEGLGTLHVHSVYQPETDGAGRVVGWVAAITDVTERKRAEAEARRLALLVEHSHDFIGISDLDLRPTYVNRAGLRMVGLGSLDEARRVNVGDFFFPEDRAALAGEFLPRVLREGHGEVEVRFRHFRTGEPIWVTYHVLTLRDDAGGPTGLATISRDITARKRAEERVRFQAHLLDAVGQAVIATDPRGRVVYWNRSAEAMYGWTAAEAEGRSVLELVVAPESAGRAAEIMGRMRAGEGWTGEFTARRRDGTTFPAEVAETPVFDDRGALEAVIGVSSDITGRKRAEERLRDSERRFARFMEHLPGLAWIKDAQGRYVYANDAAERAFGTPRAALYGRTDEEVFPPETAAQFRGHDRRALGGGEGVQVVETLAHEDGELHHSLVSKFPMPGPEGEAALVGGIAIDITGRLRAEEALRESELRFRGLMEQAPFSVQVLSSDGRTLRVNRAWEELWGLGLEQLADYNVLEDPQLEAEGILAYLRRAFSGEAVAVPAIRYDLDRSLPGRTTHADPGRWVSAVAYPLKDAAGRVREVVLVHEDISERRRAEEALRESEARFRQLADTMPQIVWVTRPDGYHEYYNRRWYDYIGCTPQECLGHGWNAPLHPDDRRRSIDRWEFALRTGEPYEIEYRFRSKDGEYRWFLARAMPVRDDAGRVVRWFGTCTDIEDMKRSERRLRRSEARYRDAERALRSSQERLMAALAASDTGTFRWEPETGAFLDFDHSLKALFGLDPGHPVRATEDILGRVHPDDRAELEAAVDRSRRGEDFDLEFRVLVPDGGVRWLYDRGKMVRDDAGRPAYLVGACTDITKRKRVEEALQDADRRKDEFLATLAHELRNPLAPIRNALRLMRGPAADCDGMEAERAMAERQVVHLARLIDDLMDVARISRGKLELHREAVDLHTVVRQAVETARTQIDDRRQRLTVSLPEHPVRLEADPTRLEQVFWNLLNNAAKYTEPGGSIDLSAEPEGGEVVVRVRDTGLGIAPEMLPRLFRMFVQVGDHRQHSQGGLGIGLGLVKTLVELHGGSIAARSDGPGLGSEFVVRLPILSGAPAPRAPEAAPTADPDDRPPGRRVLVVDDNVDAAGSLARVLARLYGQDVRVANDGLSALAVAEEYRPEVILLDIGLPGIDGYEVARRLRAAPQFAGTLIVALTGWGQESDRRRSEEARIDRHLVKPVDLEVLRRLLAETATGGAGREGG